MECFSSRKSDHAKTQQSASAVRSVISWLVEADREYRAAQSFINETHRKS